MGTGGLSDKDGGWEAETRQGYGGFGNWCSEQYDSLIEIFTKNISSDLLGSPKEKGPITVRRERWTLKALTFYGGADGNSPEAWNPLTP